jgi:hypothetical protein
MESRLLDLYLSWKRLEDSSEAAGGGMSMTPELPEAGA